MGMKSLFGIHISQQLIRKPGKCSALSLNSVFNHGTLRKSEIEAMYMSYYAKYAWGVLFYNLFVILWGAYVRASGSGAGCGSHWPLCNGEILPRQPQLETLIEFTHRMMSGIALLLVLGLFLWAWRSFPRRHPVRLGATLSMVFIITEALVGAGLVLFELVAENDSSARAIWMAAHLVNTLLLLATLTLTVWWASGGKAIDLNQQGPIGWLLLIGLIGTIILGISGAITALGDTLFPARSLAEGLSQDTSPTAHFLIRLRLLHPTIAVMTGAYLIIVTGWIASRNRSDTARRLARLLSGIVVIQLAAGVLNVYLLAPIWMQILHLFLADAVWITLILFTASVLSRDRLAQESVVPQPKPITVE